MIYFSFLYKTIFLFLLLCSSAFLINNELNNQQDDWRKISKKNQIIDDDFRTLQLLKSNQKKIKDYFEKAKKLGFLCENKSQDLKIILEQLTENNFLTQLNYKIHPTEKRNLSGFSYNRTTLYFEMKHYHDKGIFQFLQYLSEKLPGVVIPEQLALSRSNDQEAPGVTGFYQCSLITLVFNQ